MRRVGVEDVRPVAVHEDAVVVVVVEGIAADVRAAVDQQHAHPGARRETLGEHAASEAGAHDQVVEAGAAGEKRAAWPAVGRAVRDGARLGGRHGRRARLGARRAQAAHRISSRIRA